MPEKTQFEIKIEREFKPFFAKSRARKNVSTEAQHQEFKINYLKYKARCETKRLIKRAVTISCQICNSKKSIEEHHADYTNPHLIHFICRKCHYIIHKQGNSNLLDNIKPKDLTKMTVIYND